MVAESGRGCQDSKEVSEMTSYPESHPKFDQARPANDIEGRTLDPTRKLPVRKKLTMEGVRADQIENYEVRLLGSFLWTCAVAASLVGAILCAVVIYSEL
jgi:hypothetical protein